MPADPVQLYHTSEASFHSLHDCSATLIQEEAADAGELQGYRLGVDGSQQTLQELRGCLAGTGLTAQLQGTTGGKRGGSQLTKHLAPGCFYRGDVFGTRNRSSLQASKQEGAPGHLLGALVR